MPTARNRRQQPKLMKIGLLVQPYIEAALRERAEHQARIRAAEAAQEAERRARERVKAAARDANRQMRAALEEKEQAGLLDQLDALVAEIFPGTSTSPSARATAFAGHGSQALRACIAALAFGRPPSKVWDAAGSHRQPDAASDAWMTVTTHPAFLALERPLAAA
jgi:hypothetical protein